MEKWLKKNYIILLAVAVLLIAMLQNNQEMMDSRGYLPYDGVESDFTISIASHDSIAELDKWYKINAEITNNGNTGGTYASCGLYDRTTNTWIQDSFFSRGESVELNIENCKPEENNVQTARLDNVLTHQTVPITFTVKVPTGNDIAIYCETFEKCWSETSDSLTSSRIAEDITTIGDNGNDATNNQPANETEQTAKEPTISWPEFKLPDFSDDKLSLWVNQHKITLGIVAILMVLVGLGYAFSPTKEEKYRMKSARGR